MTYNDYDNLSLSPSHRIAMRLSKSIRFDSIRFVKNVNPSRLYLRFANIAQISDIIYGIVRRCSILDMMTMDCSLAIQSDNCAAWLKVHKGKTGRPQNEKGYQMNANRQWNRWTNCLPIITQNRQKILNDRLNLKLTFTTQRERGGQNLNGTLAQ